MIDLLLKIHESNPITTTTVLPLGSEEQDPPTRERCRIEEGIDEGVDAGIYEGVNE